MKTVVKVIKKFCEYIQYISYVSISALAILTVVDVVRRFIFNRTMTGVTEYSQMLLIITMTAMAHALVERRFIIVGEFVAKFPKWVDFAIEIIMDVVSFAFFAVVGWMLIGQIESSIRFREAYFMVKIVRWPFYGILGVSFLACALAIIAYTYDRMVNFFKPAEKGGLLDEAPELAIVAHMAEDFQTVEEGDE